MTPGRLAGVVLGVVLLGAGGAKRASPSWPVQARELGAPAFAVGLVPWVEVGLGAALVAGLGHPWTALAAAALLVLFTAVVARALARGVRPPCACFGRRATRPVGPWTVARNLALIAVAVVAAT